MTGEREAVAATNPRDTAAVRQAAADIRVGLITVMSEDSIWADSFIRKFEGNHAEARAALGIRTKLVHGLPGDPVTTEKLAVLCRGVAAATKLRNRKFGIGGGRSMGMYTAHVDPSVVKEGLLEFDWKVGGSLPQYVTRAGRITIARLSRVDGEYVMLIGGGQIIEYPREKLSEINPQHPQSYVWMDCTLDTFLENLRCNHVHFVFGNYLEELSVACWAPGIRPIVLPADAGTRA